MTEEKSEFGKGLVICLVKFAEHAERENHWKDSVADESWGVQMFFNAASDHLYEIEVPARWQGTPIGTKVKELQDFGLMIGHGSTGRKHTKGDIDKAVEMCREIAMLIDCELGLEPDVGMW